jgi:hypothetical protein
MTFSCGMPIAFISSTQAIPAEPAPLTTMRVVAIAAGEVERVDQPGGGDDRRAVLVVVEDRDVHQLAQRCSMTKQSGALMSSRLMPPKVGPR